MSKEQSAAADPASHVWVQANAGTGKTTVLIRRLLKLMLDGADMGSILCLTYTNAAAAEIRERILNSLKGFVTMNDDALQEKLTDIGSGTIEKARSLFYEYIDGMDSLKIQTIHGFCQEILRRFPLEAGLDPSWSPMGDSDKNRMIRDVFKKLWENSEDAELRDALVHIMDRLSEYGFTSVQKLVAGLYSNFFTLDFNINNTVQFIETIKENLKIYNFDKNDFLSPQRMKLRQIYGAKLIKAAGDAKYAYGIGEGMLMFVKGEIDFEEYKSKFITLKLTKSKHAILSEKKYGMEISMFVAAEQTDIYNAAQAAAQEELLRDTAALYIAAAKFSAEFRHAKEQAARLHYDDLILYTSRLFSSTDMMGWVISQLDSKVRHIMVDEAQDTSPAQWDIIRSILTDFFIAAGRPSLFVVGDPKQSIYSFQGASIDSFYSAEEYIGRQVRENLMEFQQIDFQKSYRTAQTILDVVDYFFNQESTTGVINWKKKSKHISGRNSDLGKVVLYPLTTEATDVENNYANQIAGHIKSRADIDPSDIMVLVKKRYPHAANIIKALTEAGVPVAGSDRVELAQALAVKDLLAALRFCLDNSDDFSLACILRSPLFEITEPELFNLCYGREGTLLDNIENAELRDKLLQIIEWSKEYGVYSFLMKLLDSRGRRENMLKRMGASIIEPLEEFLTLALSFERTQSGGIAQFIDWFMRGESTVKRDMQSASGVRVMTVYAAKGLESKAVFLVDTTLIRGKSEANPVIPIKGRRHWIWSLGQGKLSADYCEIKEAYDAKYMEEYYRLLYVAMTRARDELHIFGCAGARGPNEGSWFDQLSKVLPEFPGAKIDDGRVTIENQKGSENG